MNWYKISQVQLSLSEVASGVQHLRVLSMNLSYWRQGQPEYQTTGPLLKWINDILRQNEPSLEAVVSKRATPETVIAVARLLTTVANTAANHFEERRRG